MTTCQCEELKEDTHLVPSTYDELRTCKIFKTIWELKKRGDRSSGRDLGTTLLVDFQGILGVAEVLLEEIDNLRIAEYLVLEFNHIMPLVFKH